MGGVHIEGELDPSQAAGMAAAVRLIAACPENDETVSVPPPGFVVEVLAELDSVGTDVCVAVLAVLAAVGNRAFDRSTTMLGAEGPTFDEMMADLLGKL